MMTQLQRQGEFVYHLAYEQLCPQTAHSAKLAILDSIACMAWGSTQINNFDRIAAAHPGTSLVVGKSELLGPAMAIWCNGRSIVASEMDEGNRSAKGHPAAHMLPALLVAAQKHQLTGKQFITAFVAAYEIAARWGAAVKLRPTIHPHGNWGTAGAAAATAKARGLSAEETAAAIQLANSMPMPTSWESALQGANVRDAYVGMSNMIGALAPDMQMTGISSVPEVINQMYGESIASALDKSALTAGLGETYLVEQNYFKPYACCRFCHGAIDAILQFTQCGLEPGNISAILVETYPAAAQLTQKRPASVLAARFSIPYALAIVLHRGNAEISSFSEEALENREIQQYAQLVEVREGKDQTAMLPNIRATRVSITLKNGQTFTQDILSPTGEHDNPLSHQALMDKFHSLSSAVWHEPERKAIAHQILSIEEAADLSPWFGLLSSQRT